MPVVERHMKPGTVDFTLAENTPDPVLRAIRTSLGRNLDGTSTKTDGHLVISRSPHIDAPDLTLAVYTARLTEQTNTRSFRGMGLESHQGTQGGDGPTSPVTGTGPTASPANLTDWIDEILLRHGHGIDKGTVVNVGGTKTLPTQSPLVPANTLLRWVCYQYGAEYRYNPDGTLDAGAASDLFRDVPEIILLEDNPGNGASGPLRAVQAEISNPTIDASKRIERVVLAGEGQATGMVLAYAWDSSTVRVGWWNDDDDELATTAGQAFARIVDAPAETAASAATTGAAILAEFLNPLDAFDVTIHTPFIRQLMECGDYVLLWGPTAGAIDVSNPTHYRGRDLYPRLQRLQAVQWGIHAGHSVHLFQPPTSFGAPWRTLDLTPWMVWEPPTSRWEVGDKPDPRLRTISGPATTGGAPAVHQRFHL